MNIVNSQKDILSGNNKFKTTDFKGAISHYTGALNTLGNESVSEAELKKIQKKREKNRRRRAKKKLIQKAKSEEKNIGNNQTNNTKHKINTDNKTILNIANEIIKSLV